MYKRDFFRDGVYVIEDNAHEGISICASEEGHYWISAWAENWDDTWAGTRKLPAKNSMR